MKTKKLTNAQVLQMLYKSSTIPRLLEDGEGSGYGEWGQVYKTLKDINKCPYIKQWILICFTTEKYSGFAQDDLFRYLSSCNTLANLGLSIKKRKTTSPPNFIWFNQGYAAYDSIVNYLK
jgi:hypothetical protein